MRTFLILLSAVLFGNPMNQPTALEPVIYKRGEIDRLLETLGRRPIDFYRILRNSDGTELRVELRTEFIVFGTDGAIRTLKKSHPTWLDDSGSAVAWLENESTLVTPSTRVALRPGQEVDVDQSGTFLLLASRNERRTEIRRVQAPRDVLATVDGALWKAFRRGRLLFLVGRTADERSLRLLSLREDHERLEVEREAEIIRNGAYSPFLCHDLDSAGELLLVESTRDAPMSFLSKVQLADVSRGTRKQIARGDVVAAVWLRRNPLAAE